jgi:Flp pilus assembly CpaE family ATPase
VVNRYRKGLQSCTLEQLEQELGRTPLAVVPSDYHAVHRALDVGRTLSTNSAVRTAMRDLAQRLSGQPEARQKSGWLARLGLGR